MGSALSATLLLLAGTAAAGAATGEQGRVKGKRAAPAEVQVLQRAGIRYVVPHFGAAHGKTQNGGYVQARDAGTDRVLWDRMVYRVLGGETAERDVRDVFITRIAFQGRQLMVDNDLGERFAIDLETGKVTVMVKRSRRTALPERGAPE